MPVPLDQWQERLERHFSELSRLREASGSPLFALEHGLSDADLEDLGGQLCSRMRDGLPLRPHWLAWVVLATEHGYDYDGGVYWDPIEERTVHWDLYQRRQLRTWFKKFQQTYNGVVPSGPWAEWFTIIAWPITHAILPKYLQWQFARALYDLRYRLARLENLAPADVGRLLVENTWDASSRFREFLQQEELVGRIVLALLSDRSVAGPSPIYEATLKRVVTDLEEVQSAREWLKETRRYVADSLKGAGRAFDDRRADDEPAASRDTPRLSDTPNVHPTLMLRRSGQTSWSVVLEIPSFAGIARLSPELRTFIRSTRCRVAGSGDTWLPAGWLAANPQKRVLKSWPGTRAHLIEFERSNGTLGHLIHSELYLTQGSSWLCRIGSDGLAREISGRVVRPAQSYVLLSESAWSASHPMLIECSVDCAGVRAALLSVPEQFETEDLHFLLKLGLQVARTVRIWPAGIVGRGWDGEGHSEWLTTESPCFGIVHDHPLDAYSLRLDNGPETFVEAGSISHAVFVKLPPLPVGRHTLTVKAKRTTQAYPAPTSPPAEGVVTLNVREPEPWTPGTTSYSGLAVSIEPVEPSLDAFWEGEVGLNALGPEGRQVSCSIDLTTTSGKKILAEKIGIFDLPIMAADWRRKLSQFTANDSRAWAYLEAASGRFVIAGEELGEYVLRLERDVRPVHWICRNIHRAMTVRLMDDTGRDDAAACSFFGFAAAAQQADVSADQALAGFNVDPPGGLFVALHGDVQDVIVVSVPQVAHGLQGLLIEPDLHALEDDSVSVENILALLALWSNARVVGPFAGWRRSRVTSRLTNRVFAKLHDHRWAQAETAFFDNPRAESTVKNLERSVGGQPGFPVVLRRDHARMESGTGAGSKWFSEVAGRFSVCSDSKLCCLALRLASQPDFLLQLSEADRQHVLGQVRGNAILFRGARLVAALAAASEWESGPAPLPRWTW